MKAYQVVEQGKPLQENELETPSPSGKEVLLKTFCMYLTSSSSSIQGGF